MASNNKSTKLSNDLGLGEKIADSGVRLMHRNGDFNVVRRGLKAWTPYQDLVEMPTWQFFFIVIVSYILINAFFALLFVGIGVDTISGVEEGHSFWGNFLHAFFFSVQTFTTVGYGAMSPMGILANILSAAIALIGLLGFALFTGLLFARFSQPESSIAFSKNALIAPFPEGKKSFQFRIVNVRDNKVMDLHATLIMTWLSNEKDSTKKRRNYAYLKLERDYIFLFPLNWTVVHFIDESSPLYNKTPEMFEEMCFEFLIMVKGYDETYAQIVHSSSSYSSKDIIWDKKFAPMYYSEEGTTVLDLDALNTVQ